MACTPATKKTPTYRIETLGCKSNVYDSQRVADALEALGYRPVGPGEVPDVCIVNTCTVTSVADRKSRKTAARLARRYPAARLYVTGCYATASPQDLAGLPGLAGVYARDGWRAMLEHIHGGPLPPGCPAVDGDFGIGNFRGRARAFLKIQEGCDAFCSYCILPYVRGKPRSQPLPGVLAEAARLVEAGFGELVLTGIHLGLYGRDLAEPVALADAVRGVARTPGLGRLRISSVEATEVDAALLEAMGHPAVCAHLHLPLQSGDAAVLRRMNRRYTPEQFEAAVARARRELDRPAVTTDVIVGFPGETEPEFENTLAFCRRLRFSRMHVFPFSPRAGTPAAVLPNHVPPAVTRQRVGRLAELAEEMAAEWAGGFVDRRVRVLFERRDSAGLLRAYTDRYVPLTAPGPRRHVGRVAEVFCERNEGNELVGRVT